jgi:putative hydrolase of the HAD superfamily
MSYDHVLDKTVSLHTNRLERFQAMFQQCGLDISVAEAEGALHAYRRAYEAHRRAVPGALPLLAYLRPRVRLGVVTNGLAAVQQEKLVACQLEGLVDFLLTSEEAGVKKPDPRLFHLALARGNACAQTAILIGDSWELDVLGARQAGIRSLWLNRKQHTCPDATLTTDISAFEPLENVAKALEVASMESNCVVQ